MQLVINHLTRMKPGFVCVAGINPQTRAHVRPVLHGRLPDHVVASHGGAFDMGTVVDIGETIYAGQAPEVEDHLFIAAGVRQVATLGPKQFWELLKRVAKPNLTAIFGKSLKVCEISRGKTCALDLHKGSASLGCLIPAKQPFLSVDPYGKVVIEFCDGELTCAVGVADLRLYEEDHVRVRTAAVQALAKDLREGLEVILSVGVSRPFLRQGDTVERHWLQVNNIHRADNPIWQLQK